MKKEKIFIIIPVVIIIGLLAIIGYQLARSQFSSSDDTNSSEQAPKRTLGDQPGQGTPSGESKGVAPGSPPPSQ